MSTTISTRPVPTSVRKSTFHRMPVFIVTAGALVAGGPRHS